MPEVHGKVVAELNFGFWVYLMSRRYSTALWFPALASVFENYPSDPKRDREIIWQRADDLKFVRNRVAHHEPVHRRDLATDLARVVEFTEWVCLDSATWLGSVTRVPEVVAMRPDSREGVSARR